MARRGIAGGRVSRGSCFNGLTLEIVWEPVDVTVDIVGDVENGHVADLADHAISLRQSLRFRDAFFDFQRIEFQGLLAEFDLLVLLHHQQVFEHFAHFWVRTLGRHFLVELD